MKVEDFNRRIKKSPLYHGWYNDQMDRNDHIREDADINYFGLSEHDKLRLYVYAWNIVDLCPRKSVIQEQFGWSYYKIKKLVKECGDIKAVPTFCEHTGLISGKGYLWVTTGTN